jgi:hypothetical protein
LIFILSNSSSKPNRAEPGIMILYSRGPLRFGRVAASASATFKQYAETRPPRDLLLAVLNDDQRAKFAAFESELILAREALELHLVRLPGLPEILCH